MRWVTREKARVDRIACPWLIKRFVDPRAEFLFVPADKVMETAKSKSATPFDTPNAELGHHGEKCSFDAIIEKYKLRDEALLELSKIVRGADTENKDLTQESRGLEAVAIGFRSICKDDHDNMAKQFFVYDALYEYCKMRLKKGHD